MGKMFLDIYRCIVGKENGWYKEGNRLWYYFLALVINCMLTWWLKPEIGILFTTFSVVHFAMMPLYVYFFDDPTNESIVPAVVYLSIHLVMIITGLIVNFSWTLITIAIVIVGLLMAPDFIGDNIFSVALGSFKIASNQLIWHTIWFATFVIITFLIPAPNWIKFAIIAICMILHPFIDYLESDCVESAEIAEEAICNITDKISGRHRNG